MSCTAITLLPSLNSSVCPVQTICMTFINVVVHTCEDLNYRVYMQHEFTLLGIDKLLEELEEASLDFPALHKQIKAYQDNYFNVAALVSH